MMEPSRDSANAQPVDRIVISEIMYHPSNPLLEYIELANPTDQPVVLGSGQALWRRMELDGVGHESRIPLDLPDPHGGTTLV